MEVKTQAASARVPARGTPQAPHPLTRLQMSGLLHDVNNCLTMILGLAAGSDTGEDAAAVDRRLKMIRVAAEDAAVLVRRLQGADGPTPVVETGMVLDIRDIVRELPDLVRSRWRQRTGAGDGCVEVVLKLQDVPPVAVIEVEIRELLVNLLFNAIDAMPDGGRITLATRLSNGWVEVSVEDTGPGMPPEVLARAFDPFFTTKGPQGSGLGLSICRRIAARHGGTLTATSRPGSGSTFTLALPPSAAPAATRHRARAAVDAPQRVLLVDDDPDVRETIAAMLAALGHSVIQAGGGREALAILERERVDVLITDFTMPGLNGAEVAARAKAVDARVRTVLLTGGAAERHHSEHIDDLIGKPVTVRALGRVLEGPQASDPRRSRCS